MSSLEFNEFKIFLKENKILQKNNTHTKKNWFNYSAMYKGIINIEWWFPEKITLTNFIKKHVYILCILFYLIYCWIKFRNKLRKKWIILEIVVFLKIYFTSDVTWINFSWLVDVHGKRWVPVCILRFNNRKWSSSNACSCGSSESITRL